MLLYLLNDDPARVFISLVLQVTIFLSSFDVDENGLLRYQNFPFQSDGSPKRFFGPKMYLLFECLVLLLCIIERRATQIHGLDVPILPLSCPNLATAKDEFHYTKKTSKS